MNYFTIFFIENELLIENITITNRTVERFYLHSWYLYQSERNFVLYKTIEFLSNFILFFELYIFFSEKCIFA